MGRQRLIPMLALALAALLDLDAEGTDRGVTWKLSGRWYDFEASF